MIGTKYATADVPRFWRHLFGGQRGILQVWTGARGADGSIPGATIKERFFDYPKAAQEAAEWALKKSVEGREVFFCTHLLTGTKRIKANAAEVHTLWADLDGAPVPNGSLKPSAVVESSPGKFHAYYRLTDAIPPEVAEGLNRRLAVVIGADSSGYDLTQILRVPGTINHKYPEHPTVQIQRLEAELVYSPAALNKLLPILEEDQRNGHRTETVEDKIPEGERNKTLTSLAGSFRRRGLNAEEIAAALLEINKGRCEPPLSEGEIHAIAESVCRYASEAHFARGDASQGKQSTPTHDELRDRYISSYPDFAYGLKEWRLYSNGFWKKVPEEAVKKGISKVVEAAKSEGIRPTTPVISSVAEMVRINTAVLDDLWDANSNILTLNNGTLHIPTRELRPHSREDYAMNSLPYEFDPHADAEGWKAALQSMLKQDVIDFLQEFAGYALTVDTAHEIAIWLHGQPGGGKSTFISGLEAMLGHRAGVLGLAEVERSRFALGGIEGKTLLTATEQPSQYLGSTSVLNALISGDTIRVERKHRDGYDITPRAKLLWAMNELPRLANANDGIFRRTHIVEFPQIPPEKRNPKVRALIQTEGPGILNWALDGLDRLGDRGRFDIPESVRQASETFRDTNDIPATFIEAMCQIDRNCSVRAAKLYSAYKEWALDNGHKPQSSTRMGPEWERLGFEKKRVAGGVQYIGLRLKLAGEIDE